MPGHQPPVSGPARARQVFVVLWPVSIFVAFGLLSGAVSVITGQPGSACGWKEGWVFSPGRAVGRYGGSGSGAGGVAGERSGGVTSARA